MLNQPDLVPLQVIAEYVRSRPTAQTGVTKAMIHYFVVVMIKSRVPLSCSRFRVNLLTLSINNVGQLMVLPLDVGVYVVGAECSVKLQHCFGLYIMPDATRQVHDDLDVDAASLYSTEPLEHLQWIRRVISVRVVERAEQGRKGSKLQRK